jgi:transposase-like protein
VNYATLYGWMEKAGKTKAEIGPPVRKPETVEEEVRRLRSEVETLRMERDFLKKATAFFARTSK